MISSNTGSKGYFIDSPSINLVFYPSITCFSLITPIWDRTCFRIKHLLAQIIVQRG